MTDADLLKNTRNTRNTTGIGWGFSLCIADEGESDSEPEDASTGPHSSSGPSSDPPISEELRIVRDLDLGTRQDTAIFKSNPWTIAKLRAATRKPPPIAPSTGHSGLSSIPPEALTSTRTTKARCILDPHLKKCVELQPTPRGEKSPSQRKKLSPSRTKRKLSPVANSKAMRPNPYRLPGGPSICLDSPEIYRPGKTADAIMAQPQPSRVENRNADSSREQEEKIQPSSLETNSKGPPGKNTPYILRCHLHLVILVSVSPVELLGHTNASLSPVKQTSLHSTTNVGTSSNRFSLPHRPLNPLFSLPRTSTCNSSYEYLTASPVKPRSPALSTSRAGTKRKRSRSPLRPTHSPGSRALHIFPTARSPAERNIPPKIPVHRQRASAYDSKVFTSADKEWSTLPQKKLRASASEDSLSMTRNSFRIPGLKLPGIGNQASKKSWLLTTFQPPPLKVPSLSTSKPADFLKEDDGQILPSESINNSSSQTVVENENVNDEQVHLNKQQASSAFDHTRTI